MIPNRTLWGNFTAPARSMAAEAVIAVNRPRRDQFGFVI
jgi:hypothetical protein